MSVDLDRKENLIAEEAMTVHFDQLGFRERMMEDVELMQEVLEAMLEDTPRQIGLLVSLVESGDIHGAGRAAHKIKGSAANVCCQGLEQLAFCAEQAGKNKDSDKLNELVDKIQREWAIVYPLLKKFHEGLTA